jgi:hypothetical protein
MYLQRAMAKATAGGSAWVRIPSSWGLSVLVVAPAEAAVKWRGRAGERMRIVFHGWRDVEAELPAELQPKRGHRETPHLSFASEESKVAVEQLWKFVLARHPKATKKKSGDMRRFMTGDKEYRLIVHPESDGHIAYDSTQAEVWTWPAGGAEVLLWRVSRRGVRVRANDGEILFVDSPVEQALLEAQIKGKGTAQGAWTCKELLVGISMSLAVTDLKGVEAASVKALEPNKVYKAKQTEDGGALAVPASGTYRAEHGSAGETSWLRFVRER